MSSTTQPAPATGRKGNELAVSDQSPDLDRRENRMRHVGIGFPGFFNGEIVAAPTAARDRVRPRQQQSVVGHRIPLKLGGVEHRTITVPGGLY